MSPDLASLNGRLAKRLALGGAGQLLAMGALTVLPFLGRGYLSTGEFAFWTLMVTVSSTTVVLDFGGTPLIMASQKKTASVRRLLAAACALSCGGSLVIGFIAVGAWDLYSRHQNAISLGFGFHEIALVTLGGALRSVVACIAASALVSERMTTRTRILASQAAIQLVVTWAFLATGAATRAFALGLCVSSAAVLVGAIPALVSIVRAHVPGSQTELIPHGERASTFLGWRTAAIFLGAFITQADRWAIGAIAGAAVLASYEIAYRIATLPKLVALAIGVGLTADTANVSSDSRQLQELYGHAMKLVAVQLAVCALVITPLGLVVSGLVKHVDIGEVVLMALPLVVAHCLNGATAPGTYMCLGVAKPVWEIPYLAWTCGVLTVGWIAAALTHVGTVAVITPIVGILMGSVYFLVSFPRKLSSLRLATP